MAIEVKKYIAETFEKQAKKNGVDKVTISAIVSECNISRQAFYYYYQDIVDVANYILREKLQLTIAFGEETDNPQNSVQYFTEHIAEQFPFISLMLNSKLRNEIELILMKEQKEIFQMLLSHRNCGRNLSRKQIDFQSDLLSCAIVGYAVKHCHDCNFNKSDFSNLLWDFLQMAYGRE